MKKKKKKKEKLAMCQRLSHLAGFTRQQVQIEFSCLAKPMHEVTKILTAGSPSWTLDITFVGHNQHLQSKKTNKQTNGGGIEEDITLGIVCRKGKDFFM